MTGFHQKNVVVPVIPAEHPVGGVYPGGQTVVDLGADHGPLSFLQAAVQVLIVVHLQNAHHRPGCVKLFRHPGVLCDIHPIGGGQEFVLSPGTDQIAENQVQLVAHGNGFGAEVVSIQQPLGLEGGHQGGELGLKKVVGVAGEVEKAFIAPDDVIGVRPEDGDGEGGGDQGPPGGHVHAAGHVVQIGHDLFLPAADAGLEEEVEQKDQDQLRQAEPDVVDGSEQREEKTGRKKQSNAGFRHSGKGFLKGLLTHNGTLQAVGHCQVIQDRENKEMLR